MMVINSPIVMQEGGNSQIVRIEKEVTLKKSWT